MELFLESGVYFIVNSLNKEYYIGSSINLSGRERNHFSNLKSNIHSNKHLQNAVNKYGIENFEFKIAEHVEPEQVLVKEQEYLDGADWSILYNMNRKVNTGGSDYTRKRVVLLDLEGFVVEEFPSAQDLARYFNSTTQVSILNTDMVYKRAYRVVTFEFYEKNYDIITSWRNYTNEANNQELIQERIDAINNPSNHGVGINSTYTSAEPERFAHNAF